MVWVIAWRVEDRYADNTVGVNYGTVSIALHFTDDMEKSVCTVWMPDVAEELHRRWHEWVVLGKLELGREYAALVWCAFRSLYHRFPQEEIILVDWASCYAVRRIRGEVFVLLEESF